MLDPTVPAPAAEPQTRFDGRSFVPVDVPTGSSPADGNDDGAGSITDDAAVTSEITDDPGEGSGEDGSGSGEGGDAATRRTFWDQTPEDKRPERFNHALERSNALAAEVKTYKEKLSKYESGEGPRPTAAETAAAGAADVQVKSATDIFNEAIAEKVDEAKLSENQRAIRSLDTEVRGRYEKEVIPAAKAVIEAEKAVGETQAKITKKQNVLEELRSRDAGLYETEINSLERDLEKLDNELTRATSTLTRAELKHTQATDRHFARQGAARARANHLAAQDGQKHHEAASQKENDAYIATETVRYDKVWGESFTRVMTKLKILPKLQKAAEARAYLDVQALGKKRGDEKPILPEEFEALIEASVKDLAEFSGSAIGQSEAEAAEARARATEQPGPKKRVASRSPGDAKPQSPDEAFSNLARVMRSSRTRAA